MVNIVLRGTIDSRCRMWREKIVVGLVVLLRWSRDWKAESPRKVTIIPTSVFNKCASILHVSGSFGSYLCLCLSIETWFHLLQVAPILSAWRKRSVNNRVILWSASTKTIVSSLYSECTYRKLASRRSKCCVKPIMFAIWAVSGQFSYSLVWLLSTWEFSTGIVREIARKRNNIRFCCCAAPIIVLVMEWKY